MSTNTLHLGTHQIPYHIDKTKARRRLTIKISADCQLSAHAPLTMPDEEIHAFIIAKSSWIIRKLNELEKQQQNIPPVPTREYINGELYYFLGQQYPLQINIEANVMPLVELIDGAIKITSSKNNPKWVKTLLEQFYQQQAITIFTSRLQELMAIASWVKKMPELSFRTMKSRWGSCSHDKRIKLNYHLIKAPMKCIDHVILHELCHLQIMDHSTRFYQLLASVEPDWKKNKRQLDQFSHLLCDSAQHT